MRPIARSILRRNKAIGLLVLGLLLGSVAFSDAQTSAGSVTARLLDGAGTKLTSTLAALDVNLKTSSITLTTTQSGQSSYGAGQQAVTASAAALATNSSKAICVRALIGNTIAVYLGGSGVTTSTGWELQPGDARCLTLSNTNLVFVIAATTGATVAYDFTN